MIKNYLLVTYRSMMKNKLFLFINILGMAIAVACSIVAYLNYEYNDAFDSNHENAAQIFRVSSEREFQGNVNRYGIASMPLGNMVRDNISEVDAVVRYSTTGVNVRVGTEIFNTQTAFVDPEFFDMFSYDFIAGVSDLHNRSKIFISETLAQKLFADEPALGQIITQINSKEELIELEVGGVFRDQPHNSSFGNEAFTHFDNYWRSIITEFDEHSWRIWNTLFLQIKDPTRLPIIENQLQAYLAEQNKAREDFKVKKFYLQPFVGMAQHDQKNNTYSVWTSSAMPSAAVVAPSIMAFLILLIACFNLTNTAIAVSSGRLKEIGIRKVMGSQRKQLIVQFIAENMIVCFIALLLGMALAEILTPAYNQLWEFLNIKTNYSNNWDFLLFLLAVLLFTGLLAGAYPAFYISKFEPVSILKGKMKFGGTNGFTRVLLTLQYTISLMAIVASIAFIQNAKYQREFDLGFNEKHIITTNMTTQSEVETYRNALSGNTDINLVTSTEHHLFSSRYNDPIKHEESEIEVDILNVSEDYLETMGIKLIEGRNFSRDSENDRKEAAIITETLARKFGWIEPLGKEIVWMDTVKLYVVGMIKDVYTQGLWQEMEPMMLRYANPEKHKMVLVNTDPAKLKEVNAFMEAEWKKIFPNKVYNGWFMDQGLAQATLVNNNILKMFMFLGLVAMMLSATGLFTLVSLNIISKMKEIGVRKVLGASVPNIARKINVEFFVILSIASLLGCVTGYYTVDALMNTIWDYYQPASMLTFFISVTLMFVISATTVGMKVLKAASLNPVNTLRDE